MQLVKFQANKLSVNASKTNYMVLGTHHSTRKFIDLNQDIDILTDSKSSGCRDVEKVKLNVKLDGVSLRVRAVFHKTVRVCQVYCNFKIGFTCRITVIFGTLKDGSLLINTLASNICFSCRNMFQNGVNALSKKIDAFLSKSSKFYLVQIIR